MGFRQGVGDRERADDETPILQTEVEFILNPEPGNGYADAIEYVRADNVARRVSTRLR